jgi:hypothetical protein
MITPRHHALVALAAALALAGCGDEGGTGTPGADTRPFEERGSYQAAYQLCEGGLELTAQAYALEADREQVLAVVTEQLAGGAPDEEAAARQGCEDALDAAEGGGGTATTGGG